MTLFKSRTNIPRLALARRTLGDDDALRHGYLIGLEVAAGVCRSHIVSAADKYGEKSDAVRIGKADLYCIEREIRRWNRANDVR